MGNVILKFPFRNLFHVQLIIKIPFLDTPGSIKGIVDRTVVKYKERHSTVSNFVLYSLTTQPAKRIFDYQCEFSAQVPQLKRIYRICEAILFSFPFSSAKPNNFKLAFRHVI